MSPGFEQLLFGSVDRMVDGQERSGWQVIQQSDGLDEAVTSEIVRLIEPELSPLRPLSGFPTQDEVKAADRRLVHRTVGRFPVLLHTAPAGLDTTGRPNTMTHVVLDRSDTTVRPLLGADTWRAEWWCAPFGPELMSQARLPSPMALKPGSSVTADAGLELVLRPGAAAVLGALADVVASNAEGTDPERRQVAVLLVETVDEAAQWLGALLGTTASEPARSVNWSTLERVHGERDLERLRSSGLDIAAVPRADVTEGIRAPDRCIIVDPRRPSQSRPRTPFGRFVVAMAADPGLWLATHENIRSRVLAQLIDQTGVSFAWPAAMAQAMSWARVGVDESDLFGPASESDLRADVEVVLLQAAVPALELELPGTADALREAREHLLDGVDRRGPAEWRELCRRIGDRVSEGRAAMLGRRYLVAAVKDAAWLLGGRAAALPLPEPIRAAVHRWSDKEANAQEIRDLVAAAIRAIDPDSSEQAGAPGVPERSLAWGYLAAGFLDDGLALDGECLAALVGPLAEALLVPRAHGTAEARAHRELAQLVAVLPERGREELARQLERGLAEIALRPPAGPGTVLQPVLDVPVALALGSTSSSMPQQPWLTLQAALAGITAGMENTSASLSAIAALASTPQLRPEALRLEEGAVRALENGLLPEHIPVIEHLAASGVAEAGRWMLIAALRDPEHEQSRRYLSAQRQNTPSLPAVKRETVASTSWEEGAVLLADAASRPFLNGTMTPETTWTWAENSLAAAAQMRGGLAGVRESPAVRGMLSELSRTVALRAMAALIILSVASPQLAHRGTRQVLDLADVMTEAAQNPGRLVAPHSASWGETCLEALHALAAEDAGVSGGEELSMAAAAVLEARLRAAPADAVPGLIGEARSAFRGDSPGWARAQRAVPMLEERRSSRVERLGHIVKKNLNMLPWQKKEGRDG